MIFNNGAAAYLHGLVTPQQLADGTNLALSTCRKVIHVPNERFNWTTVVAVVDWVSRQVGPYTEDELFHPKNVSNDGRHELTGRPTSRTTRAICEQCYLETKPRLSQCQHCDHPLHVSA